MKIRVMSDLHVEFGGVELADDIDCDVVVLAGDIDVLNNSNIAAWARLHFAKRQIIWVLGNHEYYGWREEGGMDGCLAFAKADANKHGVHLLENRAIELVGVRFVGLHPVDRLRSLGRRRTRAESRKAIHGGFSRDSRHRQWPSETLHPRRFGRYPP